MLKDQIKLSYRSPLANIITTVMFFSCLIANRQWYLPVLKHKNVVYRCGFLFIKTYPFISVGFILFGDFFGWFFVLIFLVAFCWVFCLFVFKCFFCLWKKYIYFVAHSLACIHSTKKCKMFRIHDQSICYAISHGKPLT